MKEKSRGQGPPDTARPATTRAPKAAPSRKGREICVLIAGGYEIPRKSLRALVESGPRIKVLCDVPAEEAVRAAARESPDVIILAPDSCADCRAAALEELSRPGGAGRPLLLLTARDDAACRRAAICGGARGFVHKGEPVETLFKAIEKVNSGEVWFDRSLMASVIAGMLRTREDAGGDRDAAKIASMTEREREIVALIGEGLKNKEIAQRLFISEATVANHLTVIFSKLEVADRLGLLLYAFHQGLIKFPSRHGGDEPACATCC